MLLNTTSTFWDNNTICVNLGPDSNYNFGSSGWVRLTNPACAIGRPWDVTCSEVAWVSNSTASQVGTWAVFTSNAQIVPADPKRRLQDIMRQRAAGPHVIIRNNQKQQPMPVSPDVREERARETLRRVIGDKKYADYLKNAHLIVKAKSGLTYRIFPGSGITEVYDQGKMIDRLCVVLRGDFPATDSLIMRYIMILNNENQFRGLAIRHSVPKRGYVNDADMRPLSEIYNELRQGGGVLRRESPQWAKTG
jgi:hypothetical protein